MSEVQAISFYKKPYGAWTIEKTKKWLSKHEYVPIKDVHETKNMLHYRITDPTLRKYSGFISKTIGNDDKKILLTIGIPRIPRMPRISGGKVSHVNMGFQEVFPLKKESSILNHPVISEKMSNRSLNSDMVTIMDIPETKRISALYEQQRLIPSFDKDTLLGYLMKPKSEGGIGFPFPTSASIFSPMSF